MKRLCERFYFKSSNPLTPYLYVSGVNIEEDENGKQKVISYFDWSCEELAWTCKLQWAKSVSDKTKGIELFNKMKANGFPVKLVCRWLLFGWHEEVVEV